MADPLNMIWIERHGHNSEGDAYHRHALVHVSGRIMGLIDEPGGDEISFLCIIEGEQGYPLGNDRRYIDLLPAKRYVEHQALRMLSQESIWRSRLRNSKKRRLNREEDPWLTP